MKVTVEYAAQVKRAAGVATEEIDLESSCTIQELISQIAETHGDPLSGILFDTEGELQRSILVFVGDDQVRTEEPLTLQDRDVVTILSPISGG